MPPVPPDPFYAQQPTNVNSLEIVSGKVGIGTSEPTEKLTVNGNIKADDVYSNNANFEGLTLNDNATFNATTYNFGTGAATALKTAIGADSFEDQNILAVSLFA
jgi:hypothetical protein